MRTEDATVANDQAAKMVAIMQAAGGGGGDADSAGAGAGASGAAPVPVPAPSKSSGSNNNNNNSVGTAASEAWALFLQQCRRNLHLVLAFSPTDRKFRHRLRSFPSILSCTTCDW
jgi:hypothetical protein